MALGHFLRAGHCPEESEAQPTFVKPCAFACEDDFAVATASLKVLMLAPSPAHVALPSRSLSRLSSTKSVIGYIVAMALRSKSWR